MITRRWQDARDRIEFRALELGERGDPYINHSILAILAIERFDPDPDEFCIVRIVMSAIPGDEDVPIIGVDAHHYTGAARRDDGDAVVEVVSCLIRCHCSVIVVVLFDRMFREPTLPALLVRGTFVLGTPFGAFAFIGGYFRVRIAQLVCERAK